MLTAEVAVLESQPAGNTMVAIFVDRRYRRWVVRDPEGNLWAIAGGAAGWAQRQPLESDELTDYELVPKHYRYLLDLPF